MLWESEIKREKWRIPTQLNDELNAQANVVQKKCNRKIEKSNEVLSEKLSIVDCMLISCLFVIRTRSLSHSHTLALLFRSFTFHEMQWAIPRNYQPILINFLPSVFSVIVAVVCCCKCMHWYEHWTMYRERKGNDCRVVSYWKGSTQKTEVLRLVVRKS